jgi:hypothetical protein
MTVQELVEALDAFGDHITVIIEWDEDYTEAFELATGTDADGAAACVIRAH